MSKKWTIVLVVVLVLAGLYFWNKDRSDTSGTPGASATPNASAAAGSDNSVQGTGTVTYACAQSKSFVLTFTDADTARLSGPGITAMTLTKSAVDYWISADGKTVVKPAGSYIVLTQNDQIIRDVCVKK